MNAKRYLTAIFSLCLLGAVTTTQASSIFWLDPASQTVAPGTGLQIDLWMSFSAPTSGGGIDILYDSSILSFDEFIWNPIIFDPPGFDPALSWLEPPTPGAFRLHLGSTTGAAGIMLVGSLHFDAVSQGTSWVSMWEAPGYPFLDAETGELLYVSYWGSDVIVTPLPAAAWLMLVGLLGLTGLARCRFHGS